MAGNLSPCQSIPKSCHLQRTKTDGTNEWRCSKTKPGTCQFFTLICTKTSLCSLWCSYASPRTVRMAAACGRGLCERWGTHCSRGCEGSVQLPSPVQCRAAGVHRAAPVCQAQVGFPSATWMSGVSLSWVSCLPSTCCRPAATRPQGPKVRLHNAAFSCSFHPH